MKLILNFEYQSPARYFAFRASECLLLVVNCRPNVTIVHRQKELIMYTNTWKKYLPVIRILLKRSAAAEQQVTLNSIDFVKDNRLRKPVCSFNIELNSGRFTKTTQSAPAKELFEVLMQDDVAKGLLKENNYVIGLNNNFVLSIRNSTVRLEQPQAAV